MTLISTVDPPLTATSPQRPPLCNGYFVFVPAGSPYVYSCLKLSTTATATTARPQLPKLPLVNGQFFFSATDEKARKGREI